MKKIFKPALMTMLLVAIGIFSCSQDQDLLPQNQEAAVEQQQVEITSRVSVEDLNIIDVKSLSESQKRAKAILTQPELGRDFTNQNPLFLAMPSIAFDGTHKIVRVKEKDDILNLLNQGNYQKGIFLDGSVGWIPAYANARGAGCSGTYTNCNTYSAYEADGAYWCNDSNTGVAYQVSASRYNQLCTAATLQAAGYDDGCAGN